MSQSLAAATLTVLARTQPLPAVCDNDNTFTSVWIHFANCSLGWASYAAVTFFLSNQAMLLAWAVELVFLGSISTIYDQSFNE